ncbi:MAG: hypothetical protein LIO79_07465 [Rikenellaceae bacterium]|nr:hypothetical protein [Rikenellaceae bacterium]
MEHNNRKILYVWSNYIVKILLFLFMMLLPVSIKTSNFVLFTAVLLFFASYPFVYRFYGLPERRSLKELFSSPLVLYLFVLISFFYTVDTGETIKFMVYRASLGFVPLMFFLGFRLSRREFEAICAGIVPGVFLILTYYLLLGFYGIHRGVIGWNELTFSTLENYRVPFLVHRTYISFYALFAMVVVLFSRYIRYKLWFKIAISFFIVVSLLSYESRIIVGILALLVIVYPFLIAQGKKLIRLLLIIYGVASLAVLIPLLSGNYYRLAERFTMVGEEMNVDAVTDEVGYDSRAARWESAMEKIKERPWTGYGAGTEKKVLLPIFQLNGLVWSSLFNLDAHNQYISFCLENGIFAMLFYIYLLIYSFIRSIRQRNYIVASFVAICAVMSLVENILNVNWMITIFAVIISASIFDAGVRRKKFNY